MLNKLCTSTRLSCPWLTARCRGDMRALFRMLGLAPRSIRALRLGSLFHSTAQWRATLPWSSQLFSSGTGNKNETWLWVTVKLNHFYIDSQETHLTCDGLHMMINGWNVLSLWVEDGGDELDESGVAPRSSVMKEARSTFISLSKDLRVLPGQALQQSQVTLFSQLVWNTRSNQSKVGFNKLWLFLIYSVPQYRSCHWSDTKEHSVVKCAGLIWIFLCDLPHFSHEKNKIGKMIFAVITYFFAFQTILMQFIRISWLFLGGQTVGICNEIKHRDVVD